ncbi:YopX family protein [Mammaliicoccus sciuri]|uniref:YopX family protein n=1 Tax=Mammaliicoccus sciuri TaxID=1296 RepID=UPI003364F00C
MNRLRFRAWDKVNKEMIEDVASIHFKTEMILTSKLCFYPFKDIELMQSTGLFDKNGKEIYEGDIVKHVPVPNPFISNAYFEIIQARSGEWRMDNYRGGQVLAFSNHEVEVIGNKFEHPHLLGED